MADNLFQQEVKFVLDNEGGYVNDPSDPGGETKYGISSRSYPNLDIKNLTREEAKEIYRRDWWDKYGYDRIRPPKLAVKVFDMAVNMGPATAHELLQKALAAVWEPVIIDGIIGPETLGAIEKVDPDDLMDALIAWAEEHYLGLIDKNSSLERFKEGWMNRAHKIPEVDLDSEEAKDMPISTLSRLAQSLIWRFASSLLKNITYNAAQNLWDAAWEEIFKFIPEAEKKWDAGKVKKEWVMEQIMDFVERNVELGWIHRQIVRIFFSQIVDAVVEAINDELGKDWLDSIKDLERDLAGNFPFID